MEDYLNFLVGGAALRPGTFSLLLMGALVTLLVGKLGPLLYRPFARPGRWLVKVAYRQIAPRNPFNLSLKRYRRHLQRAFSTIETPLGPNVQVPFDRAYVPLRLIAADAEPVDLLAFAEMNARCVVIGGPGTGKTTLMKGLVLAVLRGKCRRGSIPVFVTLRRLAAKSHSVEQAIVAALDEHDFPNAAEFVRAALDEGRFSIVLDGLDEVGEARPFVVSQITEFCEHDAGQARHNAVFVTCRDGSYRTADLRSVISQTARTESFTNRQMRDFLLAWPTYQGRSVLGLYGQIERDSQIRDLCRNPLLMTLMAGFYLSSDDFELPPSRTEFFRLALSELLSKRSARRGIKGRFSETDKRLVLQRVSLQHLLDSTPRRDPEAFERSALERACRELERDLPATALVDDLIADGIVRWAGEDTFTLAHRTFQEYLAAAEAGRTLTTVEVLSVTAPREELSEVLAFYCGLVRNVPEIDHIVRHLLEIGAWRKAGRAVLYGEDGIDAALIEQVVAQLRASSERGMRDGVVLELEVLASIAQRHGRAFDVARGTLAATIDHVISASSEAGSAALEAGLSASPELAQHVVPAILVSTDPGQRRAAVRVLAGLDTEASLDELVRLLRSGDPVVRQEAAKCLVKIAGSRRQELTQRKDILPEAAGRSPLWPFKTYFPASIALAIAENLDEDEYDESPFQAAAHALRLQTDDDPAAQKFVRQWRGVEWRLRLEHGIERALRRASQTIKYVVVAFWLSTLSLGLGSCLSGRIVVVHMTAPFVVHEERATVEALQKESVRIIDRLQTLYPPGPPPPPKNALIGFVRGLRVRLGVPVVMPPAVPQELDAGVASLYWLIRGRGRLSKSDTAAMRETLALVGRDRAELDPLLILGSGGPAFGVFSSELARWLVAAFSCLFLWISPFLSRFFGRPTPSAFVRLQPIMTVASAPMLVGLALQSLRLSAPVDVFSKIFWFAPAIFVATALWRRLVSNPYMQLVDFFERAHGPSDSGEALPDEPR